MTQFKNSKTIELTPVAQATTIMAEFADSSTVDPLNVENGTVHVSGATLDVLFRLMWADENIKETRNQGHWRMELRETADGDKEDSLTMISLDESYNDILKLKFLVVKRRDIPKLLAQNTSN